MLDDQTICLAYNNDTYFFYKQPVYKQLAFGWQIANQLLGFKPLSLTNSKNYRYFFFRNKRKMAVKPTIHQNVAVSKPLLGKI